MEKCGGICQGSRKYTTDTNTWQAMDWKGPRFPSNTYICRADTESGLNLGSIDVGHDDSKVSGRQSNTLLQGPSNHRLVEVYQSRVTNESGEGHARYLEKQVGNANGSCA